jgi:hypothetical protein
MEGYGERRVNLLDVARGDATPGPAFSEYVDEWGAYGALQAVLGERYKMIRGVGGGSVELYDLASDPGERRNLLEGSAVAGGDAPTAGEGPSERVARTEEMTGAAARLARALDALGGAAGRPGDEAILTDEEIERLRALGYVH